MQEYRNEPTIDRNGEKMRTKFSGGKNILLSLHNGCRNVIFDALGISNIKNSSLFIAGWYLGGFCLAYSIGLLRECFNFYSLFVFLLSIVLIILLSISGLSRGHLKNRIGGRDEKNEK